MATTFFARRRIATLAGAFVLGGLLAGCSTLSGPRQVEIPLAKLQAGLDRRFPVDNRLFELLDLRLSHPRLTLLPESDRVAISLEAYVAPPFMQQSFTGTLAVSGRLYIDAARSAVFMAEPHVDAFTLTGLDASLQRRCQAARTGYWTSWCATSRSTTSSWKTCATRACNSCRPAWSRPAPACSSPSNRSTDMHSTLR